MELSELLELTVMEWVLPQVQIELLVLEPQLIPRVMLEMKGEMEYSAQKPEHQIHLEWKKLKILAQYQHSPSSLPI
tara:strand:+ start:1898 stop:2125 length:228 start_codon:yes stop_codon:yes gene_type:complete